MTIAARHLLGIDGLDKSDVIEILTAARSFSEVNDRALKKVPALRGRLVALVFLENSTRTRLSFELAAKRLSADTLSFSSTGSSLAKGETLVDTARNLAALGPDLVVVRHDQPGAAHLLSRVMPQAAVINAGDGGHEHPTQALLDAYTLLQRWGRTPAEGLSGKTIVIVGDIARSRVARSNMLLLTLLGARVAVSGPTTMLPVGLEQYGVTVEPNLDHALATARGPIDAVMALRVQKERAAFGVMASDADYVASHGLTRARFDALKQHNPDVLILHPGPINRGVELDASVADDVNSVILEQTENGVAVRMAVLYLLALAHAKAEPA